MQLPRLRVEAVHPAFGQPRGGHDVWARHVTSYPPAPAVPSSFPPPPTASACFDASPNQGRATFEIKRRLLSRPRLLPEGVPVRAKDTNTVFLVELDNFGDIGATPLFPTPFHWPAYTIIPIGGLACLWFGARPAIRDVVEGLRNIRVLKREHEALQTRRHRLLEELARPEVGVAQRQTLQHTLTDINTRVRLGEEDLQNERFDRVVAGSLIAPGSILTGLGTFLTPGFLTPAHSLAFTTVTNLFTGFVGNGPVAAYAAVNALYHSGEAVQAHRQLRCLQRKELDRVWGSEFGVDAMLHGRQRSIRNNAIVKAVSSLGVGVGGLLTAVTPFGYAVLLPFAVGRAGSEYFSQKKLGYTRKAFLQQREDLSRRSLVNELIYCSQTHQLLKDIKRRTRQRYAWGAHAPVPFRLGFQAANWLRARRHPTPEAPAAQVRAALLGYYHIRWEWLRRRQSTVLRNKTRLYAAGCGFHDAFAATQHAHLDQALHHLRRQADCAMDECEAMREQEVASMLGRDAAVWVRRIVQFFVACDLFPLLVAALYKNATLAAALPPMEPNARGSSTRLVVEAERLLADLHGQHAELLHDPAFLLAFYACVEKVLLGDVKQHFQELRREVMDMITTRLWLKEHPLPPPRLRRTAPVLLPALEPA